MKRRFLKYRSLRIRITLLVALTWLIPVLLVIFYADVQRRTKAAFESGLRYAAELTGERLRKAAVAKNAQELLAREAKPADARLIVLEPGGYNEFGLEGLYNEYARADREGLLRRLSEAEEAPVYLFGASGRLYLVQGTFTDEGMRTGALIELMDTDYLFAYLLDNAYGATEVDINVGAASAKLRKTPQGTLEFAPPDGEPVKTYGRDSTGSVGAGRNILHFYGTMDKQELLRDYYGFALVYQLFFIISPLLILISVLLYRSVTAPIAKLITAIHEIEKGGYGVQVEGDEDDEFANLARSFNSMSKGLADALDKARKQDAALNRARLLALRSQINPHFINNTLEFINWKARLGDADSVSRMVAALSAMLDGAMGRERAPLLSLSQELTYAQAYLDIIALRFGAAVTVVSDVEQDALAVPVPPLLLQPLLENAVTHGLEPRGGGHITLSAQIDGGFAVLTVSNDGALKEADAERIRLAIAPGEAAERLGLRNVAERLNLLYGGAAAFSVVGAGDKTVAEIRLPLPAGHEQR